MLLFFLAGAIHFSTQSWSYNSDKCPDADVGTRYYGIMSSTFWTSNSYANVVRRENLKKDAESRNVKLPPIPRQLWGFNRRLGVFAYLSYLSWCASVSSHLNRQTFCREPKTKKAMSGEKGEKIGADKQGVAAESWNHPGRRDARTPTRLTPPRPVPCRFTPHRVHHDVRRRNPRGDSCPAPRSRRKAVSIRPHTP